MAKCNGTQCNAQYTIPQCPAIVNVEMILRRRVYVSCKTIYTRYGQCLTILFHLYFLIHRKLFRYCVIVSHYLYIHIIISQNNISFNFIMELLAMNKIIY